MTPDRIALVCRSYAQIAPQADALGHTFYATLFRLNPASRALFRTDMDTQVRKLMNMLGSIVDGLDHPERLTPLFRALGERHAGYGVTEDQYDDVGAALLMALRTTLAADFTEEVEAAWASLYAELAETMIAAARGHGITR